MVAGTAWLSIALWKRHHDPLYASIRVADSIAKRSEVAPLYPSYKDFISAEEGRLPPEQRALIWLPRVDYTNRWSLRYIEACTALGKPTRAQIIAKTMELYRDCAEGRLAPADVEQHRQALDFLEVYDAVAESGKRSVDGRNLLLALAEEGMAEAQLDMFLLTQDEDANAAYEWLRRAASSRDTLALVYFSLYCVQRRGTSGLEYMEKAAMYHMYGVRSLPRNPLAMTLLARNKLFDGSPREEATSLLQLAAMQGWPNAMFWEAQLISSTSRGSGRKPPKNTGQLDVAAYTLKDPEAVQHLNAALASFKSGALGRHDDSPDPRELFLSLDRPSPYGHTMALQLGISDPR